jgi:hypothetical protein
MKPSAFSPERTATQRKPWSAPSLKVVPTRHTESGAVPIAAEAGGFKKTGS